VLEQRGRQRLARGPRAWVGIVHRPGQAQHPGARVLCVGSSADLDVHATGTLKVGVNPQSTRPNGFLGAAHTCMPASLNKRHAPFFISHVRPVLPQRLHVTGAPGCLPPHSLSSSSSSSNESHAASWFQMSLISLFRFVGRHVAAPVLQANMSSTSASTALPSGLSNGLSALTTAENTLLASCRPVKASSSPSTWMLFRPAAMPMFPAFW
jgi:hypothetical protein